MEENLMKIIFKPRDIIEYAKKKGSVTANDLRVDFGYDPFDALRIIAELNKIGIIVAGDYEYIPGRRAVQRLWHLTTEGEKIGKWPEKIEMIGKKFPVISKAGMEIMNCILEDAKTVGIEDLDELIEMLKLQSPKIMEIVKRVYVGVLGEFSPEELRRLAKEVEELGRDVGYKD